MQSLSLMYAEYIKLINFYSVIRGDEDANQELTVFLLELLYNVQLSKFNDDTSESLHRYIVVCIRNKYISLSKEKQINEKNITLFYESQDKFSDYAETTVFLKDWLDRLSVKQRLIKIYRYYSDAEIAQQLKISRQAVCRLKNRGLENLKKFYID